MKFRKETDSMGTINVDEDKYWGASTERSKKYFDIGKILVSKALIDAIAVIILAAAKVHKKDLHETIDALTDILYVTYGAGHAFGVNLDKCFEEVQNSNMSKLGQDGKPIYNENGKVMKGPNYFKPNLNQFLK